MQLISKFTIIKIIGVAISNETIQIRIMIFLQLFMVQIERDFIGNTMTTNLNYNWIKLNWLIQLAYLSKVTANRLSIEANMETYSMKRSNLQKILRSHLKRFYDPIQSQNIVQLSMEQLS